MWRTDKATIAEQAVDHSGVASMWFQDRLHLVVFAARADGEDPEGPRDIAFVFRLGRSSGRDLVRQLIRRREFASDLAVQDELAVVKRERMAALELLAEARGMSVDGAAQVVADLVGRVMQ